MPFSVILKKFLTTFSFLLVIVATIGGTLLIAPFTPLDIQRGFYTISVGMRSLLMTLLPLLIFPYIVCSVSDLRKNGTLVMAGMLGIIMGSNFLATLVAYLVGVSLIPCFGIKEKLHVIHNSDLTSFFQLDWSSPFCIEAVLMTGIVIGIFLTFKPLPKIEAFFKTYHHLSAFCFEKIIIPTLPFYIIGTLFKVNNDMEFTKTFGLFGRMLGLIFMIQVIYISVVFFIGNKGNVRNMIHSIRTALPAGLLGFATMSSLVTMPVTLKAAAKNTKDPTLSKMWITTSVNCHVIGESLSLPLIALTLVCCWGMPFPSFEKYIIFAFYVALAQFTGVSVPGGSLIVILPFLKSTFGFDTEMIGIITALTIFFDPFGTAQNVMGNSGMVMVVQRLFRRWCTT